MKKVIVLALAVILTQTCNKDNSDKNVRSISLQSVPSWTTIDFKSDYTIQVPPDFEGQGMVGFEGNTFGMHSSDSLIILEYIYCTGLFCYDFGDSLQSPAPGSLSVKDRSGNILVLDKVDNFVQDSETKGILYYSGDNATNGRLYWKNNGVFQQALQITFHASELSTVEKIIGSIKRK